MRRCAWLVVTTACGRIGFGSVAATTDDAAATTVDAAPCVGAAAQLVLDSGASPEGIWVSDLAATASATGLGITYVAPDGVAFGATYSINGTTGTLASVAADTMMIAANATRIDATWTNAGLLIVGNNGTTEVLSPYTMMLGANGSSTMAPARTPVSHPIAATVSGTIVVLDSTSGAAIFARQVTASGTNNGVPQQLIGPQEGAASTTIRLGGAGFVVTWIETSMSPHRVRAVLFDGATPALPGVDIATAGGADAFTPAVAWAERQQHYLFAFSGGTSPQIWVQLVDASLAPTGPAIAIGTGSKPAVASDGDSFWIAWSDPTAASGVSGAHVSATGDVKTFAITGSGGTSAGVELVRIGNQPTVLWVERSGSGHPLWAIPGCTLSG